MERTTELTTLAQARAFFQGDRFAAGSGMTIQEAAPGRACVRLRLTEAHRNAVGGVMGGVILTMADFACAVASHFGPGAGQRVSADAHVSFLRPCRGELLTAEAARIKEGRTLSFYEVLIRDEEGREVARGIFTMSRVNQENQNE